MPRVNPPAPATLGDVVRFTVVSTSQGQLCFTSHDYMAGVGAVIDFTFLVDLVAAFRDTILGTYADCLTASSRITEVRGAVISTATVASVPLPVSVVGTVAGSQLPLEVAAVIAKLSSLRGQHGRGRFFMPAVPVAFTTPATNPNFMNLVGFDAYTALCAELNAGFPAVSVPAMAPVISTRPVAPGTLVAQAAVILIQRPVLLLGTVRRRKEGRGI